jgi:hypothetical protein
MAQAIVDGPHTPATPSLGLKSPTRKSRTVPRPLPSAAQWIAAGTDFALDAMTNLHFSDKKIWFLWKRLLQFGPTAHSD